MESSLKIRKIKNNLPLVSIITPTYNSEIFIKSLLDNLIDQDYPHKEIIIVDGLSTDNTVNIINKYVQSHSYIKYITEKDNGIYEAMNKGIKLASGEWIYFIGCDDSFYKKNILKEIFSSEEIYDYDIIYGNVISPRFCGHYDGEFNFAKLFLRNICHQSIFFKKEIFYTTGLFNLEYKYLADYDHNFKWFLNPNIKKFYINKVIAIYADGGLSSTSKDHRFYLDKNKNFLKYGSQVLQKTEKIKASGNQAYVYRKNGYYLKSLLYYLFRIYYSL